MSKFSYSSLKWRAILTETLPYEVPVIFSNDRIFASLVKPPAVTAVNAIYKKLFDNSCRYTDPYNYQISKDGVRATTLSIAHPIMQVEMVRFYEDYSQSLIDSCQYGRFSLRHPVSVVSVYSSSPLDAGETLKMGIPHIIPADGEIDVSRMTSYFSYQKYNLMYKFFESTDFMKLEKSFSLMRQIDITKCFYNIYTHTISWAVKSRDFAKRYRDSYSFESRFDKLMQRSNSNETNGIIVGPEISRIFAEIILQSVDANIAKRLRALEIDDYEIRRYVDDFIIYTNSTSDLDKIENITREELSAYKLYVNEGKTQTLSRPFVTKLSRARRQIGDILSSFYEKLDALIKTEDPVRARSEGRKVVDRLRELRFAVAQADIAFSNISGWFLSRMLASLRKACDFAKNADVDSERLVGVANAISAMLEVVFYICALDLRVRTTYILCQFIACVFDVEKQLEDAHHDHIIHLITSELRALIKIETKRIKSLDTPKESVELYNLLICGSHYVGQDFLMHSEVVDAVDFLSNAPIRYFSFLSLKFCLLKDPIKYAAALTKVNVSARLIITLAKQDDPEVLTRSSEIFLLVCDYLSSPDILKQEKRSLIDFLVGGHSSGDDAEAVGNYLGCADWDGLRIEHVLERRELRPVYDWS